MYSIMFFEFQLPCWWRNSWADDCCSAGDTSWRTVSCENVTSGRRRLNERCIAKLSTCSSASSTAMSPMMRTRRTKIKAKVSDFFMSIPSKRNRLRMLAIHSYLKARNSLLNTILWCLSYIAVSAGVSLQPPAICVYGVHKFKTLIGPAIMLILVVRDVIINLPFCPSLSCVLFCKLRCVRLWQSLQVHRHLGSWPYCNLRIRVSTA